MKAHLINLIKKTHNFIEDDMQHERYYDNVHDIASRQRGPALENAMEDYFLSKNELEQDFKSSIKDDLTGVIKSDPKLMNLVKAKKFNSNEFGSALVSHIKSQALKDGEVGSALTGSEHVLTELPSVLTRIL